MLMNSTGCDIDGVSIDLLMQRLSTASGLEELACRGCDVILEAVSEDLQIKRQVIGSMFDALKANAVLPEQVIICSNTISISLERIVHHANSRTYFTYEYDGKSFRSMRQARSARSAEFFSDLRSFGYAVNS